MRIVGGTVGLRFERGLIRATDYFIALALIIFLLPMLILVAIWTALRCGLPIIARDRICGPSGQTITVLRFREASDEPGGPAEPSHPIEILLLPRLFNVLAGDLSMVGPPIRPARGEVSAAPGSNAPPGLVTAETTSDRVSYGAYWTALTRAAINAFSQ